MLHIDSTHDMREYLELLSSSREIFIDNDRLDDAVQDCIQIAEIYKSLSLMWLKIESAGVFNRIDKDTLIDYLLFIGVDLNSRSRRSKTKGYSLDMRKVIDPLISQGIAVDILKNYKEYRTFNSYYNFLKTLRLNHVISGCRMDGSHILKYGTDIQERENLRVYYHDIAVVSVPKIYSSIITSKGDDYYLAWCDYPQADWRFAYNLFIKSPENQQTMAECDDAYEGLVRLVTGDEFNPDEFHDNRAEYKENCLKVFYNSKDNKEVPSRIRKYYWSCKKYRDYRNALYVLQRFKLPIPCTSYFGYEQMLPEQYNPEDFVSRGLNKPIQTFTSEVVMETVFGVLNRFWSLGYKKDDINVYYVRHDEPIFMFKKTIIKDAWIFDDCSVIHIDGFTPIHLNFSYGSYYKEEDPILTDEIKRVCDMNKDKLHIYSGGEMREYYPVPSSCRLAVNITADVDNTTYIIFDYSKRQKKSFTFMKSSLEGMDSTERIAYILDNYLHEWIGEPSYLLISCIGVDAIFRIWDNTLVKVVNEYDPNIFYEETCNVNN